MKRRIFIFAFLIVILLSTLSALNADSVEIDFFKAFDNHGSVILIIQGETNDILYANKAAMDFYGYSIEELESMKIQNINTMPIKKVNEVLKEASDGQKNHFIFSHRLKNGEIREIDVHSYPYEGKGRTLLVTIINDITEKTRLEAEKVVVFKRLIVGLFGIIAILIVMGSAIWSNSKIIKMKSYEVNSIKENLHLILDSTAEAIYGIDQEGNCTFCNKSCLKLLRYNSENELLGENMHTKIHHKKVNGSLYLEEECIILKTLKDGKSYIIDDEVLWRADGTSFPAEYSSYPQMLDRKIIGAVITFRNIEEKKRIRDKIFEANKELCEKQYSLEEQNALIEELNTRLEEENIRYQEQREILQAIIDSLESGVMMLDLEGRITFVNNAWKKLFNYIEFDTEKYLSDNFYIDNDTLYGTEIFFSNMVIGMKKKEEVFNILTKLAYDNHSMYEIEIEQLTPIKRVLSLYTSPCISFKGQTYGRIFVVRDISYEKEIDRMKTELISTVSHELRTPMSSILGFSELIITRDLGNERQKEYMEIINSEAKRLTNLINNFLDIQRMESGRQEFKKQVNSLNRIVRDSIKIFDNSDNKCKIIHEDIEEILFVFCDYDKIYQVMTNFLSNAIKYSPDGGEIRVVLEKEGELAKVSVIDNGLGIPEESREEIFTKFYRVNNPDTIRIGGTGLGLSISKEIILSHEGEIGVESIFGKGSKFYFYLTLIGESSDFQGGL